MLGGHVWSPPLAVHCGEHSVMPDPNEGMRIKIITCVAIDDGSGSEALGPRYFYVMFTTVDCGVNFNLA